MKIKTVKLVYFSPTGTTKAIVENIAWGINNVAVELIDITLPRDRENALIIKSDELVIVAVPVYMGRVPSILTDWFDNLKADNTPAVCVVVYGNRAFDDALLELKDILVSCGCKPIAAAAFIGEHSFSSKELPSSEGRPDTNDLLLAKSFGNKIDKILKTGDSLNYDKEIVIPGNYPYGGTKNLWHLDFIEVNTNCKQCGTCAKVCPVGAVDPLKSSNIDKDKCTICCACIKRCPNQAKTIMPGPIKEAAIRCHNNFKLRKEPEMFI